jgi:hypothetical protein
MLGSSSSRCLRSCQQPEQAGRVSRARPSAMLCVPCIPVQAFGIEAEDAEEGLGAAPAPAPAPAPEPAPESASQLGLAFCHAPPLNGTQPTGCNVCGGGKPSCLRHLCVFHPSLMDAPSNTHAQMQLVLVAQGLHKMRAMRSKWRNIAAGRLAGCSYTGALSASSLPTCTFRFWPPPSSSTVSSRCRSSREMPAARGRSFLGELSWGVFLGNFLAELSWGAFLEKDPALCRPPASSMGRCACGCRVQAARCTSARCPENIDVNGGM